MKNKFAILAVFAMALAANGAQVNWGSNGILYNGTERMTTVNGYTTKAYLVYLGEAGSTWGAIDSSYIDSISSTAVAEKTAAAPGTVAAASGDNPIFTAGTTLIKNSTDKYTYGVSTFGILFVSTNSKDGHAWGSDTYYMTSDTFTLQNSGDTYTAATETSTFQQAVPSGSSWTAVPEPSTAALALAGLALLLKRRKA